MSKYQLGIGLMSSIVILVALVFLVFILEKTSGELFPSTFALIGWISGIAGMFIAGSSD